MIEAQVGTLHGEEAAHHQVGAHQQAKAQRDLGDRERGLQPLPAAPQRHSPAGFLEVVDEIGPGRAKRRQ